MYSMQIIPPIPRPKERIPFREPVNSTIIKAGKLMYLYSTDRYFSGTGIMYVVYEIPTLRLINYIETPSIDVYQAPISRNNDFIIMASTVNGIPALLKLRLDTFELIDYEELNNNVYYVYVCNITNDNNYFLVVYKYMDSGTYYQMVEIRRTSDLSIHKSVDLGNTEIGPCSLYQGGYISDNYISLPIERYSDWKYYLLLLNRSDLTVENMIEIEREVKTVINERRGFLVANPIRYIGDIRTGDIVLYSIPDLEIIRSFNNPDTLSTWMDDFALSPDGRYLAIVMANGEFYVYVIDLDAPTYDNLIFGGYNKCLGLGEYPNRVSFTNDGKYIIGADHYYDYTRIFIWNIEPFKGRNDWVFE